jgi:hypothetical protein
MTSNNIANQAFEIPNKGGSSSDYLTNKKSRLMYCNRSGICNNKGVKSYAERVIIDNGRLLDSPIDAITFDLHSNLHTQMNYSGARLITDLSGGNNITCINVALIPFYDNYRTDIDGSMFGKTVCSENNFVNFREAHIPLSTTNTIYWN